MRFTSTISQFPSPLIDAEAKTYAKSTPKDDGSSEQVESNKPSVPIHNYIDTMKVFNELQRQGFSEEQSDVILRLIKENLSHKVGEMEQDMLDTSELENEMYLFEAAQSELRVEIKTSREADLKTLESERSLLENLINEETESLNKDFIVARNDSQVLINDQISENTLLQRKIKRRIQDLNNRISTEINGDIKSDIEGLRWHTTSRGLMAVLVLVFSIMGGVSISKKKNREEPLPEVILRTLEPEEEDEHDLDEELKSLDLERLARERKS